MNSEEHEADTTAERHAVTELNKILWFFVGFFGNVWGVLVAYILKETPQASRLLGKSSEYTAFYTDTYIEKTRKLRGSWAIIGCIVSLVLTTVFFREMILEVLRWQFWFRR